MGDPMQVRAEHTMSWFLEHSGNKAYRAFVQNHFKRNSAEHNATALNGEMEMLPAGWADYTESYLDAINGRAADDRQFWKEATCGEAFDIFFAIAVEIFPFDDIVDTVNDFQKPEVQQVLYGLNQINALNFAYGAAVQPAQRKLMGIRKWGF